MSIVDGSISDNGDGVNVLCPQVAHDVDDSVQDGVRRGLGPHYITTHSSDQLPTAAVSADRRRQQCADVSFSLRPGERLHQLGRGSST